MSTHLPPAELESVGETVRRHAERLSILNEVHQALSGSIALDELLELILERVFDHLRPGRGAVYLRDPNGDLYQAAFRPLDLAQDQLKLSQSLCREVVDKGMAALFERMSVRRAVCRSPQPARFGCPDPARGAAQLCHRDAGDDRPAARGPADGPSPKMTWIC